MGPDNASYFGPWQVLDWPVDDAWDTLHIRVSHVTRGVDLIDLTSDAWVCVAYKFRDEHFYLDLILEHRPTRERISGTFSMVRGEWRSGSGHDPMDHHAFHAKFGGHGTIGDWPNDPFQYVRPPSAANIAAPDGRYIVDLTTNRWKMSDWICPPRIVEVATGDVLLDLKTTYWDARARFTDACVVELEFLKYPRTRPSLTVELHLEAERYRVIAGNEGFPRIGYIDELQAALGRPLSELKELGQSINVRPSRRGPKTDESPQPAAGKPSEPQQSEATPNSGTSGDGQFIIETEVSTASNKPVTRVRVRHIPTGQTPLDLFATVWDTAASWISSANQVMLVVRYPSGAQRLKVKIDFDCLLYWEEEGPDFGLPTGAPVLAAPLWELQERLTIEPGVIRKAERSEATGMMWPARAFGMMGASKTSATLSKNENPMPSVAAVPSGSSSVPDELERTIISPCGRWRFELYPSGVSGAAASGAMKPYHFVRVVRAADQRVIADTRRTRHLGWVTDSSINISRGTADEVWVAIDLASGTCCWENYREPMTEAISIDLLGALLA